MKIAFMHRFQKQVAAKEGEHEEPQSTKPFLTCSGSRVLPRVLTYNARKG